MGSWSLSVQDKSSGISIHLSPSYQRLWMLPRKHPFLSPMTISTKSRLSSPLLASSFTPIQSILSFKPWPMLVKRGSHYITILLTDLKSISRAYEFQSQFRSPIILPNPRNRTTYSPRPSTTAREVCSLSGWHARAVLEALLTLSVLPGTLTSLLVH